MYVCIYVYMYICMYVMMYVYVWLALWPLNDNIIYASREGVLIFISKNVTPISGLLIT